MPGRNKRKNSEPIVPTTSKMKRSVSLTQRLPNPTSHDDVNNDDTLSMPMNSSQLSIDESSGNSTTCNKCKKHVSTDTVHVTSLKCCLCENYYHGSCLDIDNPTLLSFLHVVVDIGGWACVGCRNRGGKAPIKENKNKTKNDGLMTDLALIKKQLNSISDVLKNATVIPTSDKVDKMDASARVTGKLSHSQVLRASSNRISNSSSQPSTLDTDVRTAVLSAVHTEFRSISNRSLNVVVTGLKPSNIDNDAAQFSELCASELIIYPTIKSTHRLGSSIKDKIQPLLVTLQSTDDVQEILNAAKFLRNSSSDYVRNSIFINKHLTKAEAFAAYTARERRRDKQRANGNDVQITAPDNPAVPASGTVNMIVPPVSSIISCISTDSVHMDNPHPLSATSTMPCTMSSSSSQQGNTHQWVGPGLNQIYIPTSSYVAVTNPPSSYVGPMGLGIGHGHSAPSNITLSPSNYAMPVNPPTCFGQPGFVPRFDIPRST